MKLNSLLVAKYGSLQENFIFGKSIYSEIIFQFNKNAKTNRYSENEKEI